MYKRLKMHGAETPSSAYLAHGYAQRPLWVESKHCKAHPYYAPGHTPIK